MKMNKDHARAKDWQKADARVLGQILAAQNIELVLPDTTRLAEFFAETLVTIPGIIACRVCLEDVTIQKGASAMDECIKCQASRKEVDGTKELSRYEAGFNCGLTNQPDIQLNVVNSLHHRFGFFVLQIGDSDIFQTYKPFIGNLANYVAISLENRLQKDLLQKAQEELERRVDERTKDLSAANLHLQKEIDNRVQAEENLRQVNERFSLAARASQLGVWDWDIQKDNLIWDEGMYAIYGVRKEDFAGAYDAWLKGVHPDDRIPSDEISKRAQRGEQEYDTEFRVIWPDGSIHYIKAHGQFVRSADGKPLRMTGVNFDITELKQVEEALRESEKRYKLLLNSVTDYIYTVQVQNGRSMGTTHGPGCVAVTGYTPKDYQADSGLWYRMIYEPDRAAVTEQATEILAGKPVASLEHRIIHRDGSLRWVRNTPVPHYNQQRQLIAYDGLVEDITERKRAEQALRESEEMFRGFFQQSTDGIGVVDEQARLVEWNQTLETMTGLKREHVIGRLMAEVQLEMMPPERRTQVAFERIQTAMREMLQTGQSPIFKKTTDASIYRPDGTQRFIQQNSFPIPTEHGFRIGIITRDVTEHRLAEEVLRKREQEFRTLAENSPDVIVRYDREGRRIYVNPEFERVNHLSAQEVQGKTPVELSTELAPRAAVFTEKLMAAMASGTIDKIDLSWTKDGKPICWFVRVVPEFNENGKVVSALTIWSDISERKQAEEEIRKLNLELEQRVFERTAQLEAANKELEAFAYSVSHDLRAPLRHIDGFIELLQRRTATTLDEKSQHYMATISESAKRMDMLIDDLLSFSRMGRNEMSKAQVDLGELVKDAIREFRPEIEGRNIQWRISPLPVVIGDRAMLRVALVNLISNALKFTRLREQAEIEIGEMPVSEKEIAVFIHDNGVGFDKQYADRLFGVFQRLHRADEFEGTGIGLANVRRVISRHGGKTWAEGEIGHGATFYFSLPQPKEQ